jgi:pimeloyl-ACP methyl ester carboxylesterase
LQFSGLEMLHYVEWGAGDPVIALHPLALESSAFEGTAWRLARQGLRTLAVDLPGFGRTPAPEGPLTPARLAEPVVELARSLERPPILLGMSLGGRVALEAALTSPSAFRAAVLVAPWLPWRSGRRALSLARFMSPDWAARLPLEWIWPLLKCAADTIETRPSLQHDWLARAAVRVIYYSSCQATRASFISAAREMALEPAFGEQGLWTRLARLSLPTAMVWAGRDRLIPREHAALVADLLPRARCVVVSCSGHFVNGAHYRCMESAIAEAVAGVAADASRGAGGSARWPERAPCLAAKRSEASEAAPEETPRPAHRRHVG